MNKTGIAAIAGQWPGNETDAEIEEALAALKPLPITAELWARIREYARQCACPPDINREDPDQCDYLYSSMTTRSACRELCENCWLRYHLRRLHHLAATAIIYGLPDAEEREMEALARLLGVDLSRCFDGMQLLDESSVCNTCPYRELFRNE